MKNNTKNFWQIDGDNNIFKTLKDAKYHVYVAYTPNERIKWLTNTQITHVKNEEVVSTCEIRIDDKGGYTFGKIKKI